MAWEALNNIAAAKDRPLVIVVNDNERSYAPTIGGLANHLATLRTTDGYERFLARGKDILERTPVVGRPLYETLHGAKKGLKDFIAPQGMFEDLGLKYVGPIDGHDIEALESALAARQALRRPGHRALPHREGPRLHPRPRGRGGPLPRGRQDPPRHRPADLHLRPRLDLGLRRGDGQARPGARGHRRDHRRDAPAGRPRQVRGGLPRPGLRRRHRRAARRGLRGGSGHRRAAPRLRGLRDLPQPRLRPGPDGRRPAPVRRDVRPGPRRCHRHRRRLAQRHVGHVDPPVSSPSLRIAAPRDADQVRAQLREAVEVDDAPTVVRFSKGAVGPAVNAVGRVGGMDVLREAGTDTPRRPAGLRRRARPDVPGDRRSARRPGHLHHRGRPALGQAGRRGARPARRAEHRVVVTVEDNSRVGGVGSAVAQALRDAASTYRCATSASRRASSTTPPARRSWPRSG